MPEGTGDESRRLVPVDWRGGVEGCWTAGSAEASGEKSTKGLPPYLGGAMGVTALHSTHAITQNQ